MIRLGALLLLTACTPPGERAAQALTEALAASRASVAAVPGGPMPAPPELLPPGPVAAGSMRASPGPAAPPGTPTLGAIRRRIGGGQPPSGATQLLGTAPEQLERMLGAPSLRRPEGTAEIWLYLAPSCAIDVILYRDRGTLAVAHAVARARGPAEQRVTEAECLASVAGSGEPAAAGLGRALDGG